MRKRNLAQQGVLRHEIKKEILALCSHWPGIRLVGSWAYNEAHVPELAGEGLRSFSDIDLVVEDECGAKQEELVRRHLSEHTGRLWWAGTGISIRRRSEMCDLPHSAAWNRDAHFMVPRDRAAFLRFWTAVGGLEILVLVKRCADLDADLTLEYAASKWAFLLLRNIALLQGTTLTSYHSICSWARSHSPGFPSTVAYEIKLGNWRRSSGIAPVFTSKCFAEFMAAAGIEVRDRDMCHLFGAVRSLRVALPQPDLFVSIAEQNAYSDNIARVLAYEINKLGSRNKV